MERMILVNKYDEDMDMFRYLDEGDEFRVKNVWSED